MRVISFTIPATSELIQAPKRRNEVLAVLFNTKQSLNDLERVKGYNPDPELFENYKQIKLTELYNSIKSVEHIAREFKGKLLNQWSKQSLEIERALN